MQTVGQGGLDLVEPRDAPRAGDTTTPELEAGHGPGCWRARPPQQIGVDVVIPVLNEAHVLEGSVRRVHEYLSTHVPYRWQIVIAENGSTDRTAEVARALCGALARVSVIEVGVPGRGRALRLAWTRSTADIVCYTDVDLSSDIAAFPALFGALVEEDYDVAVGSRLAAGSRTTRSFKRQMISRAYNLILRLALGVRFSDAQTGFKAVTREVVDKIVPLATDQAWFFDTELLVLAERLGYRIADIPIAWVEDADSRVRIIRTAIEDLKGIARLRRLLSMGLDAPQLLAARKAANPVGQR
jgi:glycosyltransferase involved in cell wall biosynthesis